jgi:hypothetical protein
VDPVKLVHEVCADAQHDPEQKRSRWIQRMAPMTLMRKTMGQGLEELTEKVLKPHFHSGGPSKKVSLAHTLIQYLCIKNAPAFPKSDRGLGVARVAPGREP